MSIRKIGGVFLRVKNLKKSLEFYTNFLGMEVAFTEEWDGTPEANLKTTEQNLFLTLIEQNEVQVLKEPVFNLVTDDAIAMHTALKESDFNVTEVENWTSDYNHHVLFDVYDPDGHALNIIEVQPITK